MVRAPSPQSQAMSANGVFAEEVKKWMIPRVASHKLLRGGQPYLLPCKAYSLTDLLCKVSVL